MPVYRTPSAISERRHGTRYPVHFISVLISFYQTISVAVKELTTYIHDVFDFALSKPFDEGVFQVYLTIGRSMIVRANAIEGVQDLYSALAMQLNLFNLSWKLSTGRSMEALWNTFRPPTVREMRHLRLILQIEELADSFDDLAWRSKAPFEDLVDLRRSIAFAFWRVETTDVQTSNGLEVSGRLVAILNYCVDTV